MVTSTISLALTVGVLALVILILSSHRLFANPIIYALPWANGTVASRGLSINDSGQVAVTSYQLFGEGTASRYDGIPGAGGILRNLGALPGHQHAYASAVNSSGQVAGYSQVSHVNSPYRAFRYDGTPGAGGIMRDLGTLGGDVSNAYGINDLGQVTGSASIGGPDGGEFAFVYSGTPGAGGVMHNLGALGGPYSQGAAINNAGQVTGYYHLPGDPVDAPDHAFRYDGPAGSGIMHDLELAPGFINSYGRAINASGQVAVSMSNATMAKTFVYTGTPGVDGALMPLDLLSGGTISDAVAITDSGYVLGLSDDAGGLNILPVLWRPDGSIVDLDAWLDSADPVLGQDWDLKNAYITSISNSGLITGDAAFIGPGVNNGRQLAFVLDASSLVPEPTIFAPLALAFMAAMRTNIGKQRVHRTGSFHQIGKRRDLR